MNAITRQQQHNRIDLPTNSALVFRDGEPALEVHDEYEITLEDHGDSFTIRLSGDHECSMTEDNPSHVPALLHMAISEPDYFCDMADHV